MYRLTKQDAAALMKWYAASQRKGNLKVGARAGDTFAEAMKVAENVAAHKPVFQMKAPSTRSLDARYRLLHLSPVCLLELFNGDLQLVGLPEDAHIVGMDTPVDWIGLVLIVYSKEFDPVPDNEQIPFVSSLWRDEENGTLEIREENNDG